MTNKVSAGQEAMWLWVGLRIWSLPQVALIYYAADQHQPPKLVLDVIAAITDLIVVFLIVWRTRQGELRFFYSLLVSAGLFAYFCVWGRADPLFVCALSMALLINTFGRGPFTLRRYFVADAPTSE